MDEIIFRTAAEAFDVDAALELAMRMWPRAYDRASAGTALARTENIGAWHGSRLVGAVRVLTDRYFFALGAQPGNEGFFERLGFVRGPVGYVGRRDAAT